MAVAAANRVTAAKAGIIRRFMGSLPFGSDT
jgi:putative SOS response-associated peptidase YedK